MLYATDTDLLYWEPNLGTLAAAAAQTLLSGTGTLAGTQFTLDGGSLPTAGAAPGMLLVFTGLFAGSYPIVSVDSATQLTVSRLGEGLTSTPPQALPIGSGATLPYALRTFWAQRALASARLEAIASIGSATILNPQALRRAATLGALEQIYQALAAGGDDDGALGARAAMYARRFQRAVRNTWLALDHDGDGHADEQRPLNQLTFVRQ